MFEMLIQISEAELNTLIQGAAAFGWSIGILMGFVCLAFMIYMLEHVKRKNFKMYYLELPDEDRNALKENLDIAMDTIEKLSKTNTFYFKRMHNDMCRLKTYLMMKYMQS